MLRCDVGTSTDDLYMEMLAARLEEKKKEKVGVSAPPPPGPAPKSLTPVWDSYVKNCWLKAQTGM